MRLAVRQRFFCHFAACNASVWDLMSLLVLLLLVGALHCNDKGDIYHLSIMSGVLFVVVVVVVDQNDELLPHAD